MAKYRLAASALDQDGGSSLAILAFSRAIVARAALSRSTSDACWPCADAISACVDANFDLVSSSVDRVSPSLDLDCKTKNTASPIRTTKAVTIARPRLVTT